MEDCRLPRIEDTGGMMIVHAPASVGHDIIETPLCAHIVLGEDVVPKVPSALPLAGQGADPFDGPVLRLVFLGGMVLDIVPDAVSDAHQVIPDSFGVANGVVQSTDLNPPEVSGVDAVHTVG